MAPTTRKCRKQQLRRYNKFCKEYKVKPFPCTASQASLYATYLADKLKPISIRNYLSAVIYYQKLKGHSDFSSNFVYKTTLDGIERLSENTTTVRYPMSPEDMLGIYGMLDFNNPVDKIFWLSIVIAFRGILRICHVTNSVHSIRVRDITICDDYVKIHIKTSKTDQYGQHPYDIYLQRSDGSPLCPALLLIDIINTRGVHLNSKVFTIRKKSSSFVQEYSHVNTKLKTLSLSLGLPVGRVSTHSLRHGGATFLKDLGMSTKDIMKRANWKSNAVFKYLHDSSTQMLKLDVLPTKFINNF